MSLVLAVASRAHELFEKYGSIRAELGKACGEKFYPTLLVTARPVLGRRELLLRPGRRPGSKPGERWTSRRPGPNLDQNLLGQLRRGGPGLDSEPLV